MKPRWGPLSILLVLVAAVFYWIFFKSPEPPLHLPAPKPLTGTTTPVEKPQHEVTVYFSKSFGSQVQTRALLRTYNTDSDRLNVALTELLKGPTVKERKLGYFTEIPKTTRLLALDIQPQRININLSQDFALGGGADSMTQRLNELMQTVLTIEHSRPIYLLINGHQANTLGGEGIEVPQPLQLFQ